MQLGLLTALLSLLAPALAYLSNTTILHLSLGNNTEIPPERLSASLLVFVVSDCEQF
jgi:hypothetical protein